MTLSESTVPGAKIPTTWLVILVVSLLVLWGTACCLPGQYVAARVKADLSGGHYNLEMQFRPEFDGVTFAGYMVGRTWALLSFNLGPQPTFLPGPDWPYVGEAMPLSMFDYSLLPAIPVPAPSESYGAIGGAGWIGSGVFPGHPWAMSWWSSIYPPGGGFMSMMAALTVAPLTIATIPQFQAGVAVEVHVLTEVLESSGWGFERHYFYEAVVVDM